MKSRFGGFVVSVVDRLAVGLAARAARGDLV
jgi:hypothetical protein